MTARDEMEADPHVQHVRRLLGYADLDAVDFDTLVAIGMLASSLRERDAEIKRLRADAECALAALDHGEDGGPDRAAQYLRKSLDA